MIHYGLQAVTAGANPISIKKGIDKTVEFLAAKLRENAKPVQGREDIRVCLELIFVLWRAVCHVASLMFVQTVFDGSLADIVEGLFVDCSSCLGYDSSSCQTIFSRDSDRAG